MLPAEQRPAAIISWLAARIAQPVSLRLATINDAQFILSLRLDPTRSAHISHTSESLIDQKRWMEAYAGRFALGEEAYFIIQHEGVDVGTVRLYGYRPDCAAFTWGSWVIKAGTNPAAGLLTHVLVYDLAFSCLGFTSAYFVVRKCNITVWKFNELLGAKLVAENESDKFFTFSSETYPAARAKLTKLTGTAL